MIKHKSISYDIWHQLYYARLNMTEDERTRSLYTMDILYGIIKNIQSKLEQLYLDKK